MGNNIIAQSHGLFQSTIETVATTLNITGLDSNLENHFIGCRYYADALGAATATPGAGTVVITGLDEATGQQTLTAGSLDSTDVTDKESINGNITGVRAVPTGITTATHWQLFSSSNL